MPCHGSFWQTIMIRLAWQGRKASAPYRGRLASDDTTRKRDSCGNRRDQAGGHRMHGGIRGHLQQRGRGGGGRGTSHGQYQPTGLMSQDRERRRHCIGRSRNGLLRCSSSFMSMFCFFFVAHCSRFLFLFGWYPIVVMLHTVETYHTIHTCTCSALIMDIFFFIYKVSTASLQVSHSIF